MRPTSRLLAALFAMASLALVGAGSALACHGPPAAAAAFSHEKGTHSILAVTAAYLDMTPAALKSDLVAGKTLADVAPAGKTSAGLADAFGTALKAKLDSKVTAGKISPATESAILDRIDPKLPAFAQWLWTKHWMGSQHHGFAHHHHHH